MPALLPMRVRTRAGRESRDVADGGLLEEESEAKKQWLRFRALFQRIGSSPKRRCSLVDPTTCLPTNGNVQLATVDEASQCRCAMQRRLQVLYSAQTKSHVAVAVSRYCSVFVSRCLVAFQQLLGLLNVRTNFFRFHTSPTFENIGELVRLQILC